MAALRRTESEVAARRAGIGLDGEPARSLDDDGRADVDAGIGVQGEPARAAPGERRGDADIDRACAGWIATSDDASMVWRSAVLSTAFVDVAMQTPAEQLMFFVGFEEMATAAWADVAPKARTRTGNHDLRMTATPTVSAKNTRPTLHCHDESRGGGGRHSI
ncbi:MAG: hypothetical protein JOZ72_03090 [Alphaproteobacteria bacterium]|nr:hypothetical protein [Alphaproteobacteria bacterium]